MNYKCKFFPHSPKWSKGSQSLFLVSWWIQTKLIRKQVIFIFNFFKQLNYVVTCLASHLNISVLTDLMEELGLGDADDLEGNHDVFSSLKHFLNRILHSIEWMFCMSDVFMLCLNLNKWKPTHLWPPCQILKHLFSVYYSLISEPGPSS